MITVKKYNPLIPNQNILGYSAQTTFSASEIDIIIGMGGRHIRGFYIEQVYKGEFIVEVKDGNKL